MPARGTRDKFIEIFWRTCRIPSKDRIRDEIPECSIIDSLTCWKRRTGGDNSYDLIDQLLAATLKRQTSTTSNEVTLKKLLKKFKDLADEFKDNKIEMFLFAFPPNQGSAIFVAEKIDNFVNTIVKFPVESDETKSHTLNRFLELLGASLTLQNVKAAPVVDCEYVKKQASENGFNPNLIRANCKSAFLEFVAPNGVFSLDKLKLLLVELQSVDISNSWSRETYIQAIQRISDVSKVCYVPLSL